jgi:C1A family cysteine protease
MIKKMLLLSVCLVFVFSLFTFGNDAEIKRLQAEIQKNGYTFTVGKTSVSHIPLKKLCGMKEPADWRETGVFEEDVFGKITRATPPSNFDWRDYGKVTSVKNQGSCGSCWAFGTIGSYEGALLVDNQGSQNLSEEWALDCNSYGYSCSGGWWVFGDMYNGVPMESCYPYYGSKGTCKTSCTKYFPMDAWYYVGSSSGVPSRSAIKQAIYDHGPVAAAVYATSAMQSYSGGIFNYCQSGSVNHAIVIVGWNDSNGYWIMKNSWGTGWGESGYMRIAYGCNQIGYAAAYAIPESGGGGGGDWYRLRNRYSGYDLDINSGSSYVYHYIYNGNTDKHWSITSVGSGWYKLENRNNGNALDVSGSGNYCYNYVYNGNTDKHWSFTDLGNGYYRLDNRYRGNSLDVGSGSYVYHYPWNGNTDKQWQLISVD